MGRVQMQFANQSSCGEEIFGGEEKKRRLLKLRQHWWKIKGISGPVVHALLVSSATVRTSFPTYHFLVPSNKAMVHFFLIPLVSITKCSQRALVLF
jgi:hypothetical protein